MERTLRALLYYTPEDIGLVEFGKARGWDYYPVPKTSNYGVPVLRSMFLHVQEHYNTTFYAYSNSDILYNLTLIETLRALEPRTKSHKQLMLVGSRIGVPVQFGQNISSLDQVTRLAWNGSLFRDDALDYFITIKDGYPWRTIPDFVVGRIGYDNWIVVNGIVKNLTMIDTSHSIMAMHQTDKDGDFAGHMRVPKPSPDKNINKALAGKDFKFSLGRTTCCFYYTEKVSPKDSVVLSMRNVTGCERYYRYYPELHHLMPQSEKKTKTRRRKIIYVKRRRKKG